MLLRIKISDFDDRFIKAVASYRSLPATYFFRILTYSAVGPAWFGTAAVLMSFFPDQIILLRSLFAPLSVWILGQVIKRIFRRKRPFQALPNFPALVGSPVNDSFPSLHAGSTFAFFTAMTFYHHPWSPLIGLWALLTSFSRIYLGVHYLSDILGGIFLGIIFGCIVGSL